MSKTVVICGGGIIGCATAYYLTLLDTDKTLRIRVIEREAIACHSSGKAGGFLALDWNDHGPVGPLARLSYRLHQDLANDLGTDIGYRRLETFSIDARSSTSKSAKSSDKSWMDGNIRSKQKLSANSTAQVHPYILTNALMNAAQVKGADLLKGVVKNVEYDDQTYQVQLEDGQAVSADIIVVAMGAWSGKAEAFFPRCKNLPRIRGSRAHSVVLEADVPAEAMFTRYVDTSGRSKEPEIYPRPDGTVYVCGEGDDEPLPDDPKDVAVRPGACEKLHSMVGDMSSVLKEAHINQRQACYLPCSPDGNPIIGKFPLYEGAFVATGHGCWGILNAPATGKCLAQLILDKTTDIDIRPFCLTRFHK